MSAPTADTPTRHVLVTLDAVGGVWTYALDLARGLTAAGDRVTLALLGPAPDDARREEAGTIAGATLVETGLPLDWLCDDAAPVRAAGAAIATLARQVGATLVHLNTPALAAGQHYTQPVVVAAHGCVATWWDAAWPGAELPPTLAWHRALSAEGYAAADALIAPTHAFARDVARVYALGRTPVAVHNGRTPVARPSAATLAAHALTAGRLWDRVKNIATLDSAAALAATPIHAAGPVAGPNGEQVRPAHLHLLGTLDGDALAARLAARPVFVSAATFEPFGLAVLEAAQAGCALVLADIASARELWEGAATFVPADDAPAFAAAIDALVAAPDRRRALGEAARTRASRYTPAAMARATRAVHDGARSARKVAA